MSGHTPGPWYVKPTPMGRFGANWKEIGPNVVTSGEYESSKYGTVCGVQMSEDNARLIAAAPELLEACKRLRRRAETGKPIQVGDVHVLDAAIAKATGEEKSS